MNTCKLYFHFTFPCQLSWFFYYADFYTRILCQNNYIKFSNDTQILMGIDIFNTAKDATLEPELELVQVYARGDENTTVTTRSVDGRMGIQTTSISKSGDPSFSFRSWIDSQKCECGEVYAGTAKLEILGIVPANISENLLNSLHVVSMADSIAPEQVPISELGALLRTNSTARMQRAVQGVELA